MERRVNRSAYLLSRQRRSLSFGHPETLRRITEWFLQFPLLVGLIFWRLTWHPKLIRPGCLNLQPVPALPPCRRFGHWIGTTILMRPEVRWERSYDVPAYNNGTKKNQFMVAGDIIYFF